MLRTVAISVLLTLGVGQAAIALCDPSHRTGDLPETARHGTVPTASPAHHPASAPGTDAHPAEAAGQGSELDHQGPDHSHRDAGCGALMACGLVGVESSMPAGDLVALLVPIRQRASPSSTRSELLVPESPPPRSS